MKYGVFAFLVGLTYASELSAQENDTDFIESEYRMAKGDRKIEKLESLLTIYSNISFDKADSLYAAYSNQNLIELNEFQKAKVSLLEAKLKYNRRAYSSARELVHSSETVLIRDSKKFMNELFKVYELHGLIKTRTGKYDSADYYLYKALQIADNLDNDEYRRDINNGLGINYWFKSDFRKANEAYFESLRYSESLADTIAVAYTNRNIGLVYDRLGEYSTALQHYQITLEIYESRNLTNRLHRIYNSMGVLYRNIGDFEAALENYYKSYEIREELKDSIQMSRVLQNIGGTYLAKGDHGLALEVLLQAYEIQKDKEGNNGFQVTLANLGLAYERLFKPIEAKRFYLEGLKEAERLGDKREIVRGYHRMAHILLTQAKTDQALEYGLKALSLAKELNVREALSIANHNLSRIYRAKQNYELALEHFEAHSEIQNELFNESSQVELNELRAKYEYDIQKRELADNEQEIKNLGNQNALLETRQVILLVVFIILFFSIILFLFFNRNRVKRVKLERDLSKERAENTEKHLAHEIEIKEIKFKAYTEQLIQNKEMIAGFEEKVKKYEERLNKVNETELSGSALLVVGRSGRSLSWDEFRLRFDEVHQGYTQRLVARHPDLTSNELDVSILLKINLSYKDISSVLGVSYQGVKKSIPRLYKKLGFENVDLLRSYLMNV
ncbi:tetratricopeptide repeat protein [Roseivirga misakiensis]|nr:tetratricopeptide repeat protein [Roseivirga misakiensis]